MVILEKDLRVFVKRCFEQNRDTDSTLFFVEAGKGGSEGFADVVWPYRKQMISIELKIFRDGFYLKPSQYRFHRDCAKMGIPSFVVGAMPSFGSDNAKEISTNKLIMIDGFYVDEFRNMDKKDFFFIDNEGAKGKYWVLENDYNDDYFFRSYFCNILYTMIDEALERYE
jgi:hypothetical protein